jgi:ATP-dependent Zn protease
MCTNDNQEHEHTLTQMFNELDRSKHVFLVGTSNRDGDFFDRAAIRDGRLGEPVTIPLPEVPDRFEIIKSYMQKVPTLVPLLRVPGFVKFKLLEPLEHLEHHGVRYAFWRSMVDRTEGFSGDGLRAIFNNAAMQAGAENAQYLGMGHLEGALATMLAKHTANMAQRPDQNRPRAAGLQEAQRAVPTRVASPARGSGQDAAVMDEEVPDI